MCVLSQVDRRKSSREKKGPLPNYKEMASDGDKRKKRH